VPPNKQLTYVDRNAQCYQRAENSLLKLEDIRGVTFCGTDNGLVTVTETVAFSLDDFKYYISLHNYANMNHRSNCKKWRGLRYSHTTQKLLSLAAKAHH